MKRKLWKVLSLISTTLLILNLSMATYASAVEINPISGPNVITHTTVVNEVEYMKQLQSYTMEDLLRLGYNRDDAEKILNYDFRKALLDMGKYSYEELRERGYSPEEINSIQKYDGSSDAITYLETNSLLATITFNWYAYSLANVQQKEIYIQFSSNWDSPPLNMFDDLIAADWVACDSSSHPLGMRVISASATAYYYKYNDELVHTRSISSTTTAQTAKFQFDMNYAVNEISYAKYVTGYVNLSTQSNSYNMYSLQACLGYGHSVTEFNPEVTFSFPTSVSVSLKFSIIMQELFNNTKTFKYDGTILS